MVRALIHDPVLLSRKSAPAVASDGSVADDLRDTLLFHSETCAGIAANMIGVYKNIIAVDDFGLCRVMMNARILRREGPYQAMESCVALLGGPRKAQRWQMIQVEYRDRNFNLHREMFSGETAQIIQHELDHVNGVLI